MRTLAVIATFCGAMMMTVSGFAERYVETRDPAGAPMCFDGAGNKAPLAKCQRARYVRLFDPSGAPMCFDGAGEKVPLAKCQHSAVRTRVTAVPLRAMPQGTPLCYELRTLAHARSY